LKKNSKIIVILLEYSRQIAKYLAIFVASLKKYVINFIKNIKLSIPFKYHVIFWLAYFSFNVVRWGSYFHDYWYSIKSNLVEFPIHIIVVYINVYYLIPKLILKKKNIAYILSLILVLILVYLTRTGLNYLLVTKEIWPEAEQAGKFLEANHIVAVVLGEFYVIGFVTAIKLLVDWTIEIRKNHELTKLQLSTELQLLRSQIQPHFFFNTLNSLYALTLQKSDDAPHLVIKLSEMMRYVLYEVKNAKASLLDEIKHINNYVDIKKLRFKDKVSVQIHISGNMDKVVVPPLLFLSFVENSFKHGFVENNFLQINMHFEIEEATYLVFKLENSINPNAKRESTQGIGLVNAKRRLKLLFYDDFVFSTHENKSMYELYLKIPLQ